MQRNDAPNERKPNAGLDLADREELPVPPRSPDVYSLDPDAQRIGIHVDLANRHRPFKRRRKLLDENRLHHGRCDEKTRNGKEDESDRNQKKIFLKRFISSPLMIHITPWTSMRHHFLIFNDTYIENELLPVLE